MSGCGKVRIPAGGGRPARRLACLCLLLLALLPAACEERPDYPRRAPPEGLLQDAGAQAAGRTLFLRKCAHCHGTLEEGRLATADRLVPPPSDFTHPRYARLDPAYLFRRTAAGGREEPYLSRGSTMPAWGAWLPEERIWLLVAYLRARPVAPPSP